jgi:hypothetical protein
MRRHGFLSVSALLPALLLGGCSPNTSGNTSNECRAITATQAQRPPGWGGSVFVIVMENHSQGQIVGSPSAPYINGTLLKMGADASGYHDSYVHPSEPNYVWMVAGENFGVLSDDDPGPGTVIASQSHLADQIEAAGLTWRSYQESMGDACGLHSHGLYAVKHNPFVYFTDINGWNGTAFDPPARCAEHIVDYSQLDADLAGGNLPDYVFITPNLVNDMHNGSVSDGDKWLSREVPKILASEKYRNGGVLFLLWDEGDGQSDDPPFMVVSPNAKPGFVSTADYDTSSFLKTVQGMLGLEALPCSADPAAVSAMDDLFTVPLAAATPAGS